MGVSLTRIPKVISLAQPRFFCTFFKLTVLVMCCTKIRPVVFHFLVISPVFQGLIYSHQPHCTSLNLNSLSPQPVCQSH